MLKQPKASIRLRVPPLQIAEASPPREIIAFRDRWFVHPRCLEGATLVRGKFGLSFFQGLYRQCDLLLPTGHRVTCACLFTVLPNPLFFFTFHKFSFKASAPGLFVYWYDASLPTEQRPPAPFEVEIRDHARASWLAGHALALIEEREDHRSRLYKDKADGRLWQWLKIQEGNEVLFQVTVNQWSYRFIEMRELKKVREKGGELDSEAMRSYYQTLQDDPQNLPCQEPGCSRPRARFSTLCKEHHFEAIMGISLNSLN